MSISLYEPGTTTQSSGGGTPGTVLFDNLYVELSDGTEKVLEGFEGENVWSPIPTSFFNSDVLYTSPDDPFTGARSGVFTFGTDRNRSVRGIYDASAGGVIPVVISRGVAGATGLRPGVSQIVSVSGWLVPVEITGVIELFPTLNTANSGFMLADLDALLTYMNMMSQLSTVEANELYLQKTGDSPEIVEEITEEMVSILLKVNDTTAQRAEIRRDPLQNAGWRALVFMALAVVLLAAIFGYVAYMLLVGETSEHELGFLQSLGLSKIQLLGLLSCEHLTVVALGLGVGTWAGFQMSRLMVAPLAVSDIGQSIVPPFILVTDWSLMLPTYAMILAIFITVMFVLFRSIGRTKLFELVRSEEA
jgi:ABC-type lipoprotein release transport system permease subunit